MTFSNIFVIFCALVAAVSAAPLNQLEPRATTCSDPTFKLSPCVCGGRLGIRDTSTHVRNNCPAESFRFVNPASQTDGTVRAVPNNAGGGIQCDHLVELQFLATQIENHPDMCNHFTSGAAGRNDFATFFQVVNSRANLVFLEATANNAKGQLFSGNDLTDTNLKALSGAVSYLNQIRGARVNAAATAIDNRMTTIMTAIQQAGFDSLQTRYDAVIDSVLRFAPTQQAHLLPAPPAAAGADPFLDQTSAVIAKCNQRRSLWASTRDFVVRAATGKTPAGAAKAAACAAPTKSGAKNGTTAAAGNSTAPAKGKTTTIAKGTSSVVGTSKTKAGATAVGAKGQTTVGKTAAGTTAKATAGKGSTAATKTKTKTGASSSKAKTKVATAAKGQTAGATTAKSGSTVKPATKATTTQKPASKVASAKKPASKVTTTKKTAVKAKTPVAKKVPRVKKAAAAKKGKKA